MAAVDLRFDQAEVWLLRNTFQVPRDLIPYVLLPHHPQEGFATYLNKGEDEALMKELEVEIAKVNVQREEIAMLDVVHERQLRRLQALKKVKSNLSQLLTAGGARGRIARRFFLRRSRILSCNLPPDTLSSSSKSLAVEVPSFMAECRRLLSTSAGTSHLSSSTATTSSTDAAEQPWGQTREAYLAWRVNHSKQDDNMGQDKTSGDDMLGITRSLASQGTAQDAAVSLMSPFNAAFMSRTD